MNITKQKQSDIYIYIYIYIYGKNRELKEGKGGTEKKVWKIKRYKLSFTK